jgi:hypothetical protein
MDIMRGNGSSSRNGESAKKKEDDKNAPALWPLIKQVNVRCNSAALSSGAILVDLPGKNSCSRSVLIGLTQNL